MDALVYISDALEWIATKFDDTAQAIDGIPLIGDYLAAPFYFFADNFQYVSDLFETVDDWWEWLKTSFEALPVWDTVAAQIEATWSILTMSAEDLYNWIAPYVPSLPDWFPTSLDDLIALIEENAPSLPDWFPTSLDDLVALILEKLPPIPTLENIVEWVSNAFESILDKLFEEEE